MKQLKGFRNFSNFLNHQTLERLKLENIFVFVKIVKNLIMQDVCLEITLV